MLGHRVNVNQEKLASNKTAQWIGTVDGLPGLADISGVVMDRGVAVIEDRRVPVNLINVHDYSIVLHKGKTLGEWQPMTSAVKMVSSDKKHNRAETAQPDKQVTIDDVAEHARSVMDGETQSHPLAEQLNSWQKTLLHPHWRQ